MFDLIKIVIILAVITNLGQFLISNRGALFPMGTIRFKSMSNKHVIH